ncbi:MAG: BON domain-containing protein [Limnobacter sp.]|nr:BON domain-containing protein [Limnobacter sp.]
MTRKTRLTPIATRIAAYGVVAALVAPLLSGCLAAVGVGAATAVSSAADRRTVGTQVEDNTIHLKVTATVQDKWSDNLHVNATVYNRKVLLTGEVPDQATASEIGRLVTNIPNVQGVINELQVAGISALTARSNDAFITTKVKAALLDAQDVGAATFKVTTEAGVVYLMGLVTAREADRATDIAATQSGVRKVVRVFELISEEELVRMRKTNSGELKRSNSGTPAP